MLIPFKELLAEAQQGGYAVGYFEPWDLYSLEAVLEAAETENSPVILGFGCVMMEPAWLDGGGLERFGAMGLATAQAAKVPVSFILNEATTFPQVVRGIQAGFNAVMLDSCHLPYQEHLQLTQQEVQVAHAVGVGVEAEVGQLPDASGEMGNATGQLTDPAQAARFVDETGIDALAVSVGNVHILTRGEAVIDWERLAAIQQAVSIPLVIHGGTGFPDTGIARAIELGVAKFNIGTTLKKSFLAGVIEAASALPAEISYQQVMGSRKEADVLQQGKIRMRAEVIRRIRLMRPDLSSPL
jgi:ketose-bisphosphate aldolase